jgi:hypothetical protein
MSQINDLLDASIEADGFRIPMVRERPSSPYGVIDVSAIDFAARHASAASDEVPFSRA